MKATQIHWNFIELSWHSHCFTNYHRQAMMPYQIEGVFMAIQPKQDQQQGQQGQSQQVNQGQASQRQGQQAQQPGSQNQTRQGQAQGQAQ